MSAAHPAIAAGTLAALATAGRRRVGLVLAASLALLAGLGALAIARGAVPIPAGEVLGVLFAAATGETPEGRHALVILGVRLPRVLLAMLVGAALALSGAVMQGLFRNPLADPGLVGVSAGAALAAGATIVLGDRYLAPLIGALPFAILPFGAFLGGLASTLTLYAIATRNGRTSIATMLLAGVALGALSGALSGFLAYLSDDRQLRDLAFWSLGSFGGASWVKLAAVAPIILPLIAAAPFLARGLNALALGEAEAFHLGMKVQRIKNAAILLVALAVGASVAVSGIIGFVGIVVPHLVRLVLGANHRVLLPASAIGGATLLTGADLLARTLVVPAELPIGILTAALGAPFFLWLLLRRDAGLSA
ncbi:FecCD family ABC transporter permease [Rhabdaerophilum calidifontis]|uniref:FecCD family ABC transporter permease n=1 Tax=Rhabdaerophilum calidifontis TaxID=2604328 RepID=UPI003CCC60B7